MAKIAEYWIFALKLFENFSDMLKICYICQNI